MMIRHSRGVPDLGLVLLYVSYRPCLHDRSRAGIYRFTSIRIQVDATQLI